MTIPLDRWAPEIHAGLVRMLERPSPGIAVFDWDDTVLTGDIGIAILELTDEWEGTHFTQTYLERLAAGGRDEAYPLSIQFFAGRSKEAFRDHCQRIVDTVEAEGRVQVRPEIGRLIDAMHERGWQVWVVTASPQQLIQCICERVGIAPERVIGLHLEADDEGVYTDQIRQPMTFYKGKADAILHYITSSPTFVAGDSPSDEQMMDLAEHALLIDSGNESLSARGESKGWWVQRGWSHSNPEHLIIGDD